MRGVQGVLEVLFKNEHSFCSFEGQHDQTFVNSWNGLLGQVPMIAAGEVMDSILKNEKSVLKLIDIEEYMIAKPFFAQLLIKLR